MSTVTHTSGKSESRPKTDASKNETTLDYKTISTFYTGLQNSQEPDQNSDFRLDSNSYTTITDKKHVVILFIMFKKLL